MKARVDEVGVILNDVELGRDGKMRRQAGGGAGAGAGAGDAAGADRTMGELAGMGGRGGAGDFLGG